MDEVRQEPAEQESSSPEASSTATATATATKAHERAILEVEDLQMYFPVKSSGLLRRTVGHVQAVDGVSFHVDQGECVGIVGDFAELVHGEIDMVQGGLEVGRGFAQIGSRRIGITQDRVDIARTSRTPSFRPRCHRHRALTEQRRSQQHDSNRINGPRMPRFNHHGAQHSVAHLDETIHS